MSTTSASTLDDHEAPRVGSFPKHVAIIMDGNGRWAHRRGLSRSDGHRAGTENVRRVLKRFVHYEVEYLTVFAFSTENWDRPDDEVGFLMELLREAIVEGDGGAA